MAATEVTGPEPGGTPSAQESKAAQVASLTGMRGFAALMVVLVHTAGRTEYPGLGVHGYGPIALFVLSGFLLYRPFARWILGVSERPSLRSFAIRRASRILPAYWVVLLVWMFVYEAAVPDGMEEWVRNLTLTSSLEFFTLPPGLEQTWSLGTELTWYVALPVMAAASFVLLRGLPEQAALRAHFALLACGIPVSVAWTVYCHEGTRANETLWLPGFLACFATGAFVALTMEAERAGRLDLARLRRLAADPWLVPGVAVFFLVVGTSDWSGPVIFAPMTLAEDLVRKGSAMGLAGALLVLSVFAGPRAGVVRVLSSGFMQVTGRWSYGIYLWHVPVIVLLWEEASLPTGTFGLLTWLALVLVASYVLAAATYEWVEKPAMAWSQRHSARFNQPRTNARAARRRAGTPPPGPRSAAPQAPDAQAPVAQAPVARQTRAADVEPSP